MKSLHVEQLQFPCTHFLLLCLWLSLLNCNRETSQSHLHEPNPVSAPTGCCLEVSLLVGLVVFQRNLVIATNRFRRETGQSSLAFVTPWRWCAWDQFVIWLSSFPYAMWVERGNNSSALTSGSSWYKYPSRSAPQPCCLPCSNLYFLFLQLCKRSKCL